MDRRYRMELQLVRVPVVWKAKVPEKKLLPVTRKVPEERARERRARAAAHMFFARLFEGVPPLFTPTVFQEEEPKGKLIIFKRFTPLPGMEDRRWTDG